MLLNWLQVKTAYYDREKNGELKTLKKRIRLQPYRVQCQDMCKALPLCLKWDRFVEVWKLSDLILTSLQKVCDWAQALLFQGAKVTLLYHLMDRRKQNLEVIIQGMSEKEELILNDMVLVDMGVADEVIKNRRLAPGLCGHSHLKSGTDNPAPTKGLDH